MIMMRAIIKLTRLQEVFSTHKASFHTFFFPKQEVTSLSIISRDLRLCRKSVGPTRSFIQNVKRMGNKRECNSSNLCDVFQMATIMTHLLLVRPKIYTETDTHPRLNDIIAHLLNKCTLSYF